MQILSCFCCCILISLHSVCLDCCKYINQYCGHCTDAVGRAITCKSCVCYYVATIVNRNINYCCITFQVFFILLFIYIFIFIVS